MSESKKENKILAFINNWGLLAISMLIIIAYTIFSSTPSKTQEQNIWSNILFIVLNLLAAFYIARKVSVWGWETDNATNQKKIAKTAIRHNRANWSSILRLIKITREKIDLVEEPLTKQYLKEIKNHLEMISNGIKNSESDFKEIINEELKEQNTLEIEISDILEEIEQKNNKVKVLEAQAEDNSQTIGNLRNQIKLRENELSQKVSSLPFGPTGSAFIITEPVPFTFTNNDAKITVNSTKDIKDLSDLLRQQSTQERRDK